ncbi:putative T7SS-secreted protein [Streptomyces sp. NPDC051636]|uniref:putative T7SS-secreted protein n=1 Tax=Streptomyces sp. NPDC051636 TaxID=3365663 RepID=UPI0037B46866
MSASSKPRPRDWHPLADSDPVPGDPEEIRDEVKHMVSVAESLREQARLLRGIKNDNELKGKYAGKLRDESEVLEKHLREVAERYEHVHGHLTNWANELEDFQSDADKVLANAKKEQEELEAEKAENSSGDKDTPLPSESGEDHDPLRKYREQLDRITGDRDDRAEHYARKIGEQLNDVIKDSWWDNVKGWVHDNADWIKTVLDGLGWVATIAGIVAIWIPVLNFLVLGIAILTILTRSLLVASGDASWTDLAFDVGGLLLMGIGRGGLAALKGANKVTSAAAQSTRTAGLKAGLRSHKGMLNDLSKAMANAQDDVSRKFFSDLRNYTLKKISRDTGLVAKGATEVSTVSKWLHLGDDEAAGLFGQLRANKGVFPGAVAGGASKIGHAGYAASMFAAYGGMGVDVVDKSLSKSDSVGWLAEHHLLPGDKPYNDGYNTWKESGWMPASDTHW